MLLSCLEHLPRGLQAGDVSRIQYGRRADISCRAKRGREENRDRKDSLRQTAELAARSDN
jgi:hypothetical protein